MLRYLSKWLVVATLSVAPATVSSQNKSSKVRTTRSQKSASLMPLTGAMEPQMNLDWLAKRRLSKLSMATPSV